MKKSTQRIVVIVVFLLVLVFGIGQFFTSNLSNVNPSASSTDTSTGSGLVTTGPGGPPTQIVAYVPPQPASSALTESGSCWTNSIAAPFRQDAWRCSVGNGISDPCFQIPQSKNLFCNINPANPNSTSSFVLKLTQPLPESQTPPVTPPSDWAWLIQLSDGTLCSPFTGTLPPVAGDHSANYGCAPGPLGKNILIFDDLNTSSSVWTATIGVLSTPTSSSALPVMENTSTVAIETIWQ